MTGRPSPSESARLLRQRVEMGGEEIFLDGMSREEALRRVGMAQDLAQASAALSSPDVGPAKRTRAPQVAKEVTAALPVLPDGYDELREVALACTGCRLHVGRTQVVFSDGPSDARLMVVGEAPGANEDKTGIPFVGQAGKYLDLLLATVGLSREDSVYIANVLKCRPPGNRNPLPDEIVACSAYLRKQIDLVQPEALLAVGSFSGQLLTGREKTALGKLRGQVHAYHGVPLVVTYHPAALLRNSNWTRLFWDDLQLLRGVLDKG
jgi:uracil-DNA glycosylase family 4